MKTATKYEIRRSVRRAMMPSPNWEAWRSIPVCQEGCMLFVAGHCAWTRKPVVKGEPCKPCVTKGLERVK